VRLAKLVTCHELAYLGEKVVREKEYLSAISAALYSGYQICLLVLENVSCVDESMRV
jgi:hypothetical protein